MLEFYKVHQEYKNDTHEENDKRRAHEEKKLEMEYEFQLKMKDKENEALKIIQTHSLNLHDSASAEPPPNEPPNLTS